MITDGAGNCHYLAVKSISRLLRGIIQRKRNLENMKEYVKTMIFVT